MYIFLTSEMPITAIRKWLLENASLCVHQYLDFVFCLGIRHLRRNHQKQGQHFPVAYHGLWFVCKSPSILHLEGVAWPRPTKEKST